MGVLGGRLTHSQTQGTPGLPFDQINASVGGVDLFISTTNQPTDTHTLTKCGTKVKY